ncbi:aminopeptidase N [Ghiorsea bivora]|uniref:aminopeptidase N n=1 Tax=Ghiorsea bivora TaxID=1485545 RepID=UPI00056DF14A|nr:aminopeptidase N [Ghiorsea bivora]
MNPTIYLKDYKNPNFSVKHVSLCFELNPEKTVVTSSVRYERQQDGDLLLDGEGLALQSIALDGNTLDKSQYELHDKGLTIINPPQSFTLDIITHINPQANTALEGLYRSSGNYCTQCEAQGFRRITYYQDRPDVMATFSVEIIADKATNPVLLSNGNPVESGNLDDGKHYAKWHDPFPKPCYLFALVAGDLAQVEDRFTTQSGRNITLQIYTEAHHIHQCDFAMASLKRAMAWDEQRFGLEYDLDLFMIVAVDDFNMGAMENKGLNIFNSRLVFASPETATDDDYIAIEAVIGHEYFHNWTGNRVTCRDWFQLSLKEGLTVFRDQEFTADMHSRAVKRIEDVRLLRAHQFAEDASPMAHPIRPASFVEINNFYTVTVYEKGAEVVRLYHSLLGEQGFRKGMDLYFERHDGQAVTTEDFLSAMADANNRDLSQMQTWYEQAGTPRLKVSLDYNKSSQTCTLTCEQSCPATPESKEKKPYLIPFKIALLDDSGNTLADESTLLITKEKQSFTFENISSQPIPSLLRDFSAPVLLEYDYSDKDYAFLMQFDNNAFNRWAAAQALATSTVLSLVENPDTSTRIINHAFKALIANTNLEPALKAKALSLPSLSDIQEAWLNTHDTMNPVVLFEAKKRLKQNLAKVLQAEFLNTYQAMQQTSDDDTVDLSDKAMQQRKLQNVCLSYLASLGSDMLDLAYDQFESANNMTNQYAALAALSHQDYPQREQSLKAFEAQWEGEANVMDKWFGVQAASSLPNTLNHIQTLKQHPKFSMKNPNKVRALIGAFAMRNPLNFHAEDGSGYQFIADSVLELDKLNPQIASRIVRALMDWKRLEPTRQALMKSALERIANAQGLSGDVAEIVNKSLGG